MTWAPRRGRRHPHRGHKMTAAEKKRLSQRMRGRHHPRRKGTHHKGRKLTAAQRRKISQREKGRKHPHRGRKGAHHRHANRRRTTHRHAPVRHRTGHRHATRHHSPVRIHRRSTRSGSRHLAGRGPVRAPHPRRGRIYPSQFGHRRRALHSRFNHHKRVRALRAPFVAGRRRVRAWK